jgi:Integrase zinc binding domain
MNHFRCHRQWPADVPKARARYLQNLAIKLFQDAHHVVWIRLDDYQYPRIALYLPEIYRKMALCEAHNNQFGAHNAALKTYIEISSSYYWPKLWSDILNHTKTCLRCQCRKKSTDFNLFRFRNGKMSEFMLIFSDQFSQQDANTNISCVSPTPSRSICLSQRLRTRKPKWYRRPFSTNGFVNSASRCKFTLTAGRSLLTSFQVNCLLFLMFNILKQLWHIPSAMPRLKFSTKQSRST